MWNNLGTIIKNPDETFYNEKNKGLEFYKKVDGMVVVAVRINFGEILKIKSFYPPVNKNKINNRNVKKEQMIIDGKIEK